MSLLKKLPGNEMVAVCDVYEPRLLQAAEIAGPTAAKVADYRRILDDREIDAVVIGTPDHWHKTITLDAVAAGKDVYVEKPVSHTIAEGAEMVKVDRSVEADRADRHAAAQLGSLDAGQADRRLRAARPDHVRPDLLVSARDGRQLPAGRDGQARLEALARTGAGPAVPPGALLPVASLLGLRRRLPDRPHDALDRRRALVHERRGAARRRRPPGATTTSRLWEAPDTVNATLEFPKNFMAAYLGTYVSRVDDGGLEFRGDRGTLKIDRARLAFYRDDAAYAPGTLTPEPEIYVRSSGDGTLTHLQNWLDCIRSRKAPNAHIRIGHQAARTSHIANAALRGRPPGALEQRGGKDRDRVTQLSRGPSACLECKDAWAARLACCSRPVAISSKLLGAAGTSTAAGVWPFGRRVGAAAAAVRGDPGRRQRHHLGARERDVAGSLPARDHGARRARSSTTTTTAGWTSSWSTAAPCDFYTPKTPLTNALYKNNRDGTFTDVTDKAGVAGGKEFGMGCAVGDYDNDGYRRHPRHRLRPLHAVPQQRQRHVHRRHREGGRSPRPAGRRARSGSTTTTTAGSICSSAASSSSR